MIRVSSFSKFESEFIERVSRAVWCNAATIDTRDRVRSRILHPIWEGPTGWASAKRHSLKSKHLARKPYLGQIFKGLGDPDFGVLKFSPWRIELFDISNPANRKVWFAPSALDRES